MPSPEFVELLLASPAGQICAANIVTGIRENVILRTTASLVLTWWEHLVAHDSGYQFPSEIIRALNAVRDREYPSDLPNRDIAPDFRLEGPSEVLSHDTRGQICCALPAFLFPKLMHSDDLLKFTNLSISFPARANLPGALDAIQALMALSPTERQVRLHPLKSFGQGLVWYARKNSILNALRRLGPTERPDGARDALGLVHRQKDDVLILVSFPAIVLSAVKSARPTFVDAGGHARFKCKPDEMNLNRGQRWGVTANLRKFHDKRAVIDGCQERVCGTISATYLPTNGLVSFEPLGRVL